MNVYTWFKECFFSYSDMNDNNNSIRNSRRRKKKLELVQQAADEELAEISFEQQMLRELNLKPRSKGQTSPSRANPVLSSRSGQEKPAGTQPGILKVPPQNQSQGKKGKMREGILDLSAMIDALEVSYDQHTIRFTVVILLSAIGHLENIFKKEYWIFTFFFNCSFYSVF